MDKYKEDIETAAMVNLDKSVPGFRSSGEVMEEITECRERIKKLEQRFNATSGWFTAERKQLRKKIQAEEEHLEKLMYRMAGCGDGQIEYRGRDIPRIINKENMKCS